MLCSCDVSRMGRKEKNRVFIERLTVLTNPLLATPDKQPKLASCVVLCICNGSSKARYKQTVYTKLAKLIDQYFISMSLAAEVHLQPFCQQFVDTSVVLFPKWAILSVSHIHDISYSELQVGG